MIKALGDKFGLAYYSDFRVDNQEAARPATALWEAIDGDRTDQRSLRLLQRRQVPVAVCTTGLCRVQMQERPPDGTAANSHDAAFYDRQLRSGRPTGR